jgi:PEP-CTERM motif
MKTLIKLTTATLTLVTILAITKDAQASTLQNGWNYAIDSFTDSTYRTYPGSPTSVGGGTFEIYGLAMKDDIQNNQLTFAFNTNLAKDGAVVPVANGYSHIGWGDLFIQTASGLLGVNFTDANDSAASIGVYQVTGTTSVAVANDGWTTNSSYTNFVASRGGNPNLGDLAQNQSPFGNATHSVIASGQWIGNLLAADLTGLNFGQFSAVGSQTFGFSIDRSFVTPGDITAWAFQECFNDGIALNVNILTKPVPEPSTLIGMIALAAMGVFSAKNSKNNKKVVVNA